MAGVSTWGSGTALRWKHPCKRPGCGNDAAAGAAPAYCSDSALGTSERQWWLNMTTAAKTLWLPCRLEPAPHSEAAKEEDLTAEEQHQPLWCPPGHTESIALCSPRSRWPQLELSQLLGQEGKHAGKAGPLPTQELFPK